MSKNGRQTIGSDLMDQLDGSPIDLLTSPTKKTQPKEVSKKINGAQKTEKPTSSAKERMTIQISKDTIERVKDAVYWERLTVASFVEEALEASLNKHEKQRGEPFPKRKTELRPGRPTK